MVDPEQGDAQQYFAGRPEGGLSVVGLIAAPAAHDIQRDEDDAQRHLDAGHAIDDREDGVLPSGNQTLCVVGTEHKVHEYNQHEIEGT